MKDLLVGSTGFVGGNLMAAHTYDGVCHSSDISRYFGSQPELCVYAGIPSAMFLANKDPEADMAIMRAAMENILRIVPKKLVLISTIAVYLDSRGKYEQDAVLTPELTAYGYNRLQLEQWVRREYRDALIVRLPALYGLGLKKNFLYDLRMITPAMLRVDKYNELAEQSQLVRDGYTLDAGSGLYKLNGNVDAAALREWFCVSSFNALCFTDSRSVFQFYNLGRLWRDITKALSAGITCLNLTPPPVSAAEVYEVITGRSDWVNELTSAPFYYDLRSEYAGLLGGSVDGYLCSKADELEDIRHFMHEMR